jgi:phosphate transport system substrate-binding protein
MMKSETIKPETSRAMQRSRSAASLLFACLFVPAVAQQPSNSAAPGYVAHPVRVPKNAEYVLPDGEIYIAGNDLVAPLLERINAMFEKQHPGFHFKMDLISSGVAVAGVVSGKSAFGPTGRDVSDAEKDAFRSRFGYAVTDVLVGWDNNPDADHYPPTGKFPPGVWVNARNPVPAISMQQLASILTEGSPAGDITRWSEIRFHEAPVGNNGADYAKREIHIYMPALHGLPVVSTTRNRLGNFHWSHRVEYLPLLEDVINAVANDPFGIGLAGWFPTDEGWDRSADLMGKVRLLPLQQEADAPVSHGGQGDLYPLAGGIHILLNKAPGQPLDPWLKEYVTLLLSREGQNVIRELTKTDGFLPLSAEDDVRERGKLDDR